MTDIRTHNEVLDTLESLIDHNSVRYVLKTLAEICSAKADHISENWQDEGLAKAWDDEAQRILYAAFQSRLT